MIFHPGILALLLGSGLTALMLSYAAGEGLQILRHWDMHSGSERQLELERRTYLVSTVMTYALGFQVLSLFLFIYTADTLSRLFVGAMCAAGSLKVNGFGYPTLVAKIVNCLLAGLWLIVNATDNRAHDYPLIRTKYWLLLFLAPFILAETTLQAFYLLGLAPNIITSCCGTIFAADAHTLMSDLLAIPASLAQAIFFTSAALVLASGLNVYLRGRGAGLFAVASLTHFIVSVAALISFISIYFYELPTHHCPFCVLHREYGHVGYALYLAMLVSAIAGIGTGVLSPFGAIASLRQVIPRRQKRLALLSLGATLIFVLLAGYGIVLSNLSMKAY